MLTSGTISENLFVGITEDKFSNKDMMKLQDLGIYAYNLLDGSVMERRSNVKGGVSLMKGDLIKVKVD